MLLGNELGAKANSTVTPFVRHKMMQCYAKFGDIEKVMNEYREILSDGELPDKETFNYLFL